ncbi:Aspyridones efflux protein apdF [Vanrija pseudolonga]|uniref:Aspyridones efflux protein apdF n=1 Tax=Vanrija pseudolonga TaxID=143232 RepID=A0AAF0YE45_9TREE|nr:Aspyridones efflux protein apdF [Vanrija pseudolonga]
MASSNPPVDATKAPLDMPKAAADADIELNTLNRTPTASTARLNNPGGAGAGAGDTAPETTDPHEASRALDASAPDGGLHAWAMVGCCSMLGFWFVGVTYSWGVLQTTLVERHLAPASTLAFVGSIAVSMLSFMAILNSRILTSLGARKMAIIGTFFMSFSQIFASFTTRNVGGLFVTAGVMMGLGVGFCFMVISITPAQYFTTKRGTAVGIVYAAGGLGGAVISLALEAGVRNIGLEWTFRLVGLLILVTCLPAAWYVKERTTVVRKEFVDWSLFRNLDFLVLFASGALATFPLFVPPFFLPLYAQSMHLSGTTGAALVCVFNFSSAIGRILTGFLSDRLLGPLNTLFAVLFVTCLSLLVLWPSSVSLAPLIIFVLVNGASSGGFFAIMPTVVNNVMGSQRMTVAFGMIVTGWGGGYLMGAPIAGYLLAAYGGEARGIAAYRPAVFWAGGMAAGAALLVAFLRWRKSPHLMINM